MEAESTQPESAQPMNASVRQSGFTLIELLVVVMIIGILAAIALPSFQGYLEKARFTEVYQVVQPVEELLTEYYARWGQFPDNAAAAGIANLKGFAGKYVREVRISPGVIYVDFEYEPGQGKKTVWFAAAVSDSSSHNVLAWYCTGQNIPTDMNKVGEILPSPHDVVDC